MSAHKTEYQHPVILDNIKKKQGEETVTRK